jgi:hypothetical protein
MDARRAFRKEQTKMVEQQTRVETETVRITVNGKVFPVTPGEYQVARLKNQTGVQPQDNLEQVVDGQIQMLDDNGTVVIRGQEEFVTVPRTGAGS